MQKLPETEAKEAQNAVKEILNPLKCYEIYLNAESEASGIVTEDNDEELDAPEVEETALGKLKSKFNKATGDLLELLINLQSAKHLKSCKAMAAEDKTVAKQIQECQEWQRSNKKEGSEEGPCELLRQLTCVVQSFEVGATVTASAAAPAPSLIAALGGAAANENEEYMAAERDRVWKLVQAERKKYISFSIPRDFTKDKLSDAFRAASKVYNFSGSLNMSHRLVMGSADLLHEFSEEPWANASKPADEVFQGVADFLAGLTGSTDFAFAFDGRMRECRRILDPWLHLPYLSHSVNSYSIPFNDSDCSPPCIIPFIT